MGSIMKPQKVMPKTGEETDRVFEAVQIDSAHLRALVNWGTECITILSDPQTVLSETDVEFPTALVVVETELGPLHGFEGDWVYKTDSGQLRVGGVESIDSYEVQ